MPTRTVDEDLNEVERDIRMLKIEYEQFFGGGRSRPPADTQWRLESLMRRYNDRSAALSVGQRFRFNNLAQTYAKYVEMWRKKTVQKESATARHHYGAAARAVEAERARQEARVKTTDPHEVDVLVEAASQAAEQAVEQTAGVQQKDAVFALSFSDPEHEKEKIGTLYQKLVETRTQTAEKTGTPSLGDFERFVSKKTKELQQKGAHEIEYSVLIEGGHTKLKARVSN